MRCTDCHKPLRPVVAVDIDGTLGQYHQHFLTFAEGWLGRYVDPRYDGSVDLAMWLGVSKDIYRQVKLAYRQGGMKRTMPPYEGVLDLTSALVLAGCELWITTTRPYMRLDNVDPDTREWLRRNVGEMGVHYDGLIYDEDKYARLVEIVGPDRVVGVVEDLPEQFARALNLGLGPLMIKRQHNEFMWNALAHEEKAATLNIAGDKLTQRIRGWLDATK